MTADFPVALILMLGGLAVPLWRGRARAAWMLLLPVAAFAWLLMLPHGEHARIEFLGQGNSGSQRIGP